MTVIPVRGMDELILKTAIWQDERWVDCSHNPYATQVQRHTLPLHHTILSFFLALPLITFPHFVHNRLCFLFTFSTSDLCVCYEITCHRYIRHLPMYITLASRLLRC